MISINENKLYQWDTARVIRCTPPEGMRIDEIHVDNHTRKNAIVLDVYEESGYICANIPDVCLQKPHPLHVYAVMKIDGEENTIESATFTVIPRKKPEDYVYEEEELRTYKKLEEKIEELEEKIENIEPGGGGTAEVEISETEPTDENVDLWVKPSSEEEVKLPEIKDDEVSAVDTWSSQKINAMFTEYVEEIADLVGGDA